MKKIIIGISIAFVLVASLFIGLKALGFSFEREPSPISHKQFDMGEFLVNLKDEHRCYLRTQIIIEYVHSTEAEKRIIAQQAKCRDKIITVLRSKCSDELLEEEDLLAVRNKLISELEIALDLEDIIVDLWFVNFVIQ